MPGGHGPWIQFGSGTFFVVCFLFFVFLFLATFFFGLAPAAFFGGGGVVVFAMLSLTAGACAAATALTIVFRFLFENFRNPRFVVRKPKYFVCACLLSLSFVSVRGRFRARGQLRG